MTNQRRRKLELLYVQISSIDGPKNTVNHFAHGTSFIQEMIEDHERYSESAGRVMLMHAERGFLQNLPHMLGHTCVIRFSLEYIYFRVKNNLRLYVYMKASRRW